MNKKNSEKKFSFMMKNLSAYLHKDVITHSMMYDSVEMTKDAYYALKKGAM